MKTRSPIRPAHVVLVAFACLAVACHEHESTQAVTPPSSSSSPSPAADRAGTIAPITDSSLPPHPPLPPGACAPPSANATKASSPDGKTTVYVSTDPTRTDSTAAGDVPHEDLCLVHNGAPPVLLLAGRGAPDDAGVEATLAAFEELSFSPDGSTLYFSSAGWATSPAAHAIDLSTHRERFLEDGAVESTIAAGPYRGMLVMSHFRLDPDHDVTSPKYRGRMEVWSIVTPQGKSVRRLPEDEAARARVVAGGAPRATGDAGR